LAGGVLVIVSQAVAVLGYYFPHYFDWTKDEVSIPDAPDILPTALLAFILAGFMFGIGTAVRFFFDRRYVG